MPTRCAKADATWPRAAGSTPEQHAEAVRRRYGKDRTFSVPILMTCALAGLVPWREVPPLPFELACLPQSLVPLPAAAGRQLRPAGAHRHRPGGPPPPRLVEPAAGGCAVAAKSLRVLEAIQPTSGGYLEATPLTSFVDDGPGEQRPAPIIRSATGDRRASSSSWSRCGRTGAGRSTRTWRRG